MAKPSESAVWHPGEVQMQRTVGSDQRMAWVGPRAIRPAMPDQHREFFATLPMLVLGTVDVQDRPWATLRFGTPGFVSTPSDTRIAVSGAHDPTDPAQFEAGDPAAVLGIELATRRRNRANGRVASSNDQEFVIAVEQSFGNCPRYISRRQPRLVREPGTPPSAVETRSELDRAARELIQRSDTFFVASYSRRSDGTIDADVSHRGGPRGFVSVADEHLTIPDYAGNQFFNTFGNFVTQPFAGLLFMDLETGDMLQLSGSVEVSLDPALAAPLAAERVWTFKPSAVVRRRQSIPFVFEELEDASRR